MSQPGPDRSDSNCRADIAIVGMACFFPKAPSLQDYWRNIAAKVDAIGEPPPGNLLHQVFDPGSTANDRVYSLKGGFLDALPPFRPSEFGVMPRAIDGAEPEHFMALQVAQAAMVDAGFPELPINRDKTEVILGRGTYVNRGFMSAMQHSVVIDQTIGLLRQLHPEYTASELALLKEKLKVQLPPFSPETAPGLCHNLVAGLIANRLDLHGRNLVMDAACATCLLALEIAADDLIQHKCDAAIVGGVQISTHAPIHMIFSHLGALSRQPHLRPFDQNADGTMLGEGIGMVVIKRLDDAIRDRHRIYAVIKGIGSSSDGRGSGLLAPRLDGEVLALRRAYAAAGLDPATIELIEAHGTGIPLGDATEISALRTVFGSRNEGATARCAVGTVKSMIGHLIPAAGIAGIIKTALALHHKVLPPTLFCDTPNPDLHLEQTPFYLNTETRPWIHGHQGYPRRAGVNAFGFGGINAHVVLEEYAGSVTEGSGLDGDWEVELFVFCGDTREHLLGKVRSLSDWLASPHSSAAALADISYTVNADLAADGQRLAVLANNRADLEKKLHHVLRVLADPTRRQIKDRSGLFYFEEPLARTGKVAFLFPGEGSQYVNMLADLCRYFPAARACFDLLDRAYAGVAGGHRPSAFIFPPPGEHDQAAKKILNMDGAADAVSTANRALFRILADLGITPDAVVGHSSGELAALEAGGAVALSGEDDVLSFIRIGNSIIESLKAANDIPHGKLLAVGGVDAAQVDEAIGTARGFLCLAMANCPHQFVLCGTSETVAEAEARLRQQGAICQVLPFQRAYHTQLFQAALQRLQRLYEDASFQRPETPLYSCLTASRYPDDPEEIRRLALQQWVEPVRFHETVSQMHTDGVRIFIEVGPRANLTGFVNDILKDLPHCAVATNAHHRSGIRQLLHALGLAAAHGVPMQLSRLYRQRRVTRLDLSPQALPEKMPGGLTLNRDLPLLHLDGIDLSFLSKRATAAPVMAGSLPTPTPSAPEVKTANPVLDQYFQTMERFLDIQRQTMDQIMGASPGGHHRLTSKTPVAVPVPTEDASPPAGPAPGPQQHQASAPSAPLTMNGKAPAAAQVLLLRLVSERTGYPEEMLALDQDLEAELGIDSIKRVEILGALAKALGGFDDSRSERLNRLRTLGEIIHFLEEPAPASPASRHPMIDRITIRAPGREVEIESVLDLDQEIFLRDHTLGGTVSRDDHTLHGLAVMPFAMSLELLAAAAAELFPGQRLSGFRAVQSMSWIIFKTKQVALTVLAQKAAQENQAVVRLFIGNREGGQPAMEGTVLFSGTLTQGQKTAAEQPPDSWSATGIPKQFYPLALFHGPAFQNVGRVLRWGEGGAVAELAIQQQIPLFHDQGSALLLASPLHLDAAGQVVGLWAAHFIPNQYVIFPVAVEEIRFHDPGNAQRTACLTASATDGDAIRSDIVLHNEAGAVACRITGLRHKRINMPEYLHHFRGSREVMLSRPWPLPPGLPGGSGCFACGLSPAGQLDFTGADGEVLREVIAHIILSRQEREQWHGLRYPETRKTEWLLARLTGKEAIRRLLAQQGCADVWPADIAITASPQGQPQTTGPWLAKLMWQPRISLSHAQGNVVALAARLQDADTGGIGIDIETSRVLDEEFAKVAFTPAEMALISGLPEEEKAEWRLRIWCAREAAVKALGGLPGQPLIITDIDRQSGTIYGFITVAGSNPPDGRTLLISSVQQDGVTGAVCVYSEF